MRCIPDGDNLASGQDLADILFRTEHDAAAESWCNQGTCGRSSHSSSMPRIRDLAGDADVTDVLFNG
jgi:hypothetical protein